METHLFIGRPPTFDAFPRQRRVLITSHDAFRYLGPGRPAGAQLLGAPLDEARLLRVGAALEQTLGFAECRPSLPS